MGLGQKILDYIAPVQPTIQDICQDRVVTSIPDDCCKRAILWQYEYALAVVTNILSSILANTEWSTYREGTKIEMDDYFRLNYQFNSKESASETYQKIAYHLIHDREVLLIELASKEVFVADAWQYKDRKMYLKPNTFVGVKIVTEKLNRTFKEGRDALLITMPNKDTIEDTFQRMCQDYANILNMIQQGANKAMGTKLNLELNAQGKNSTSDDFLTELQKQYQPLMEQPNTVFITYKGETLKDLTEKQRGSEVQQVLDLGENTITVNKEILVNVGRVFGIPSNVIKGEFTEDSDDIYSMLMTFFAKPILKTMSEKFTLYFLDKEDVLRNTKIVANMDSVRFQESLSRANAIDKLIASGAYTINEVREKLGDDPVKDGDTRFITKNYAVLDGYEKGGLDSEA